MNDLDAIIEVIDEISHVKRLDDDTLSHAYDLCMELIEIFGNEMTDRGLIAEVESK